MEMAQLNVSLRTNRGKGAARKLRAVGQIPGVVYGLKKEPITIAFEPKQLTNLIRHSPMRWNTMFDVSVDGGAPTAVMVKVTDVHPVSRDILHVDLINIDQTQKLRVDVPLKLVGRSEGVKAGGRLQQLVRTLKVECLPKDIPASVEVDVTALDRKQSFAVDAVQAPEGCELVFRDVYPVAVVS